MLDQLRGMAVLANVAEAGSFSGAARRLGMSASVVSYHVTALEQHFDTPLIYRTTRRLSLTTAGEKLANSARAMLREVEIGFGEIGTENENPTGKLKITAPGILQYSRFVTRTSTFIKRYPRVEVSMSFSDKTPDIVADGFDIGFRLGPLEDSTLMARKLVEGRMIFCAAPNHRAAQKNIRTPKDLSQIDFVGVNISPSHFLPGRNDRPISELSNMKPRVVVDSGFTARRMAEEGVGAVLLPDFFVREQMELGHLVEIFPDFRGPGYSIHAVWPANIGTNHLRNSFLNYVAMIANTGPESDRVPP